MSRPDGGFVSPRVREKSFDDPLAQRPMIASLVGYPDRAEALEAVGLRD